MRTRRCRRSRPSIVACPPARYHRSMSKSDRSKAKAKTKSKRERVKALPWALLLQLGTVLGRRWRSLSAKDRARLTELTRESQGRLSNLSEKQRKELKKLVGKLDLKSTSRELVLLTRARRRLKRR
jgi:hypothetical protein